LDEIANDITGATPASFEPALDYVVVKVPRFDFAKFPSVAPVLGTSMQSVGEAMAIGRTFPEALQKAMRSLETGRLGLNGDATADGYRQIPDAVLEESLSIATPERLYHVGEALRRGQSVDTVAETSRIDRWFVDQIRQITDAGTSLSESGPSVTLVRPAKRMGFSDAQLGHLWNIDETEVRSMRVEAKLDVTYKTVDTCAAEFAATTPYFYSTYEDESEAPSPGKSTVMVLGSGPNRIGQGIEFDYCCVHAAFALEDAGYDTVMVNCNPETVSTDYDTSTRLYFEPLTVEDVLAIVAVEQPEAVIVQLGGQTPLGLADALQQAGVPVAGTPPDAIDAAEDRERFSKLCGDLGISQPPHGTALSVADAMNVVDEIGLPALVRPSYVLGGRAMRIIYSVEDLSAYLSDLYGATPGGEVDLSESPLLIDRFLESAIEVDVDAVFDGEELFVGGIMEHVEEAGVHSGDSACVVPPPTLSPEVLQRVVEDTHRLAAGLGVRGLINIQFAVRGDDVFVLEANPRASRTVPFISKATGVPLAKVATRVMMGESIRHLRDAGAIPATPNTLPYTAVKEAVLPWNRFPREDTLLGPEMRATGEVMGIGAHLGEAYAKALKGAGHTVPTYGSAFISLADRDKATGVAIASVLANNGLSLFATHGTAGHLARNGIKATHVDKVGEGPYDPVKLVEAAEIDLIVNTPAGGKARGDGKLIRMAANRHGIPCVTTAEGALAVANSITAARTGPFRVTSLQQHHAEAGI
jgi:carbamoyl-phosphate synthase large subunit